MAASDAFDPRVTAELEALRQAEPPRQDSCEREQIVQRVLELAATRTPRPAWRARSVPALAAAALAVAALFVFWVSNRARELPLSPPTAAVLTLRSGSAEAAGTTLEQGAEIAPSTKIGVIAEQAELVLWDSSTLRATRGTKLTYSAQLEDRVLLEDGEISLAVNERVRSRPVVVQTAEAEVWVVGTQFVVRRVKLGSSLTTIVRVSEGLVRVVEKTSGQERVLGPAQQVAFSSPVLAERASEPPSGARAGKPADEPSSQQPPASETDEARGSVAPKAVSAKLIRQRIREGAIGNARQLIQQARARGTSDVELSVLEAEADLAERRYASAKQRYLKIFERYPATAQGELSLFAAAQLSRGSSSIELLQRYLARYPNGRFSREAHRLLDALDAPQSKQ